MEVEKHKLDVEVERLLASERMSEQLMGYRLLQVMVRKYSPASDEGGFSDPIGPTENSSINEPWARHSLKRLLQLLRDASNLALATAGLNLLTVLVRTRPTLLPVMVPALIDLWEKQPEVGDPRSLAHALRMQLTNITAMPNAEKYFPLVMDALSNSSSIGSKKRVKTSAAAVVEEDVDVSSSTLRAQLDIARIPVELVAQVIIGSVQFLEEDVLMDKISRWRPTTTTTTSTAATSTATLDPRRKRQAAPAKDAQVQQLDAKDLERLALDSLFRLVQQGMYLERLAVLAVKIASFLRPSGFARIVEEFGSRVEEMGPSGKLFSAIYATAVWMYHPERYEEVLAPMLALLVGAKPDWLPHFVNAVPSIDHHLVLQLYGALMESAQYALAMDVIVAVVQSRQGRNLDLYYDLFKNSLFFKNADEDDLEDEKEKGKKRLAVIEGVCKLYPKYGKQEFESLLVEEDGTRDLFYAMIRVNLDLVRTISLEQLAQLPSEEREMLGRALARSPMLLDFLKRMLSAADDSLLFLLLELIKSFVPRTPELHAMLFEMITTCDLDACFGIVLFNRELSKDAFALLWPKFLTALVNSPLVTVLSPPTNNNSSSSNSVEEVEREKLVHRWCGKFVELGLCTVVDIFIQVHVALGADIKTCNSVVKTLLGQAAWRSPGCLMPALLNLADRAPLPVLFYRTLLTIISLGLSSSSASASGGGGGINLLSVVVKSFKGRPWEQAHLWEGVVRCVKALLPGSSVAVLQLPMPQVLKVIEAVPAVKQPLREYLSQQPPSYRSRFKELVPLLK